MRRAVSARTSGAGGTGRVRSRSAEGGAAQRREARERPLGAMRVVEVAAHRSTLCIELQNFSPSRFSCWRMVPNAASSPGMHAHGQPLEALHELRLYAHGRAHDLYEAEAPQDQAATSTVA